MSSFSLISPSYFLFKFAIYCLTFYFCDNPQKHPELILVDSIKEETEDLNMEMDSSCDSAWNNLDEKSNIEDKIPINEEIAIKTEEQSLVRKSVIKRSKTVPLITPSTPIVSVNSNEPMPNKDLPKNCTRTIYPKRPKMCTVCGEVLRVY